MRDRKTKVPQKHVGEPHLSGDPIREDSKAKLDDESEVGSN